MEMKRYHDVIEAQRRRDQGRVRFQKVLWFVSGLLTAEIIWRISTGHW
jgi:hypothetical protein